MRQSLLIIGVVIGTFVGFFIYCAALIDWIQDYTTGVYAHDHLEATVETLALLAYSFGGFRFYKWRIERFTR